MSIHHGDNYNCCTRTAAVSHMAYDASELVKTVTVDRELDIVYIIKG